MVSSNLSTFKTKYIFCLLVIVNDLSIINIILMIRSITEWVGGR